MTLYKLGTDADLTQPPLSVAQEHAFYRVRYVRRNVLTADSTALKQNR